MPREPRPIRRERARHLPFPAARSLFSGSTATLATHRVPPFQGLRVARLDQSVEPGLHLVQQHGTDSSPSIFLARRERKELGLQMATRYGIAVAPANEQQVRREWVVLVSAFVGYDFDAIGCAIAALERRGSVVDCHVPADRVGIALRVIGRYESAHIQR